MQRVFARVVGCALALAGFAFAQTAESRPWSEHFVTVLAVDGAPVPDAEVTFVTQGGGFAVRQTLFAVGLKPERLPFGRTVVRGKTDAQGVVVVPPQGSACWNAVVHLGDVGGEADFGVVLMDMPRWKTLQLRPLRRVRVVGHDGLPVAGAQIAVARDDGRFKDPRPSPAGAWIATTDAEGKALIHDVDAKEGEAPTSGVMWLAPTPTPVFAPWPKDAREEMVLRLPPTARLEIEDGECPGDVCGIHLDFGDVSPDFVPVDRVLPHVPASTFMHLRGNPYGSRDFSRAIMTPAAGGTLVVRVRQPLQEAVLYGRVESPAGVAPADRVLAYFIDKEQGEVDQEATIGADGSFVLLLPSRRPAAGRDVAFFFAERGEPLMATSRIRPLRKRLDATNDDGRFSLGDLRPKPRAPWSSGVLIDMDGWTVPGVEMELERRGCNAAWLDYAVEMQWPRFSRTDEDGRFAVFGLPHRMQVSLVDGRLTDPDTLERSTGACVVAVPLETVEVVLDGIDARIRDAADAASPSAVFEARRVFGPAQSSAVHDVVIRRDAGRGLDADDDDASWTAAMTLAPGRWNVTMRLVSSSLPIAEARDVEVREHGPDDPRNVISLASTRRLRRRVVLAKDEAGSPLSYWHLNVRHRASTTGWCDVVTDDHGVAYVDTADDSAEVVAYADGFEPVGGRLSGDSIELKLRRASRIPVRINVASLPEGVQHGAEWTVGVWSIAPTEDPPPGVVSTTEFSAFGKTTNLALRRALEFIVPRPGRYLAALHGGGLQYARVEFDVTSDGAPSTIELIVDPESQGMRAATEGVDWW